MAYVVTISEKTKQNDNELGHVVSIQDVTPSPREYDVFNIYEIQGKTALEVSNECDTEIIPEIRAVSKEMAIAKKILGEGKYEKIIETPVEFEDELQWNDNGTWKSLNESPSFRLNYDGETFTHNFNKLEINNTIIETEFVEKV